MHALSRKSTGRRARMVDRAPNVVTYMYDAVAKPATQTVPIDGTAAPFDVWG